MSFAGAVSIWLVPALIMLFVAAGSSAAMDDMDALQGRRDALFLIVASFTWPVWMLGVSLYILIYLPARGLASLGRLLLFNEQ